MNHTVKTTSQPPDIKSLTLPELSACLTRIGEKPYRAKQLYEWLHQKQASSFDEMTNLSKPLRSRLAECFRLPVLRQVQVQESKLDGTRKYLFALPDGNMIESVLMKYRHGNSVCISSQAGCRMGCRFCASAIGGLVRSLEPSEMLEQIYRIAEDTGERISNVVVMGTGEPLDNFDNLLRFLELLTDENGMHVSQRSITVSTCGIIPKMYELAQEHLQITLALSLHGSTQEKRRRLMPVADAYGLEELLKACDNYFQETGRRITFEYSLIHGVNDTQEDVQELVSILKPRNCHLNLIPVNPVKERNFIRPDSKNAQNFKNKLEKNGINVTIRREMGADIDGACGQLRRRYIQT